MNCLSSIIDLTQKISMILEDNSVGKTSKSNHKDMNLDQDLYKSRSEMLCLKAGAYTPLGQAGRRPGAPD